MAQPAGSPIRQSSIAGRWYTANPERLRAQIEGFLDAAGQTALSGETIGVVAPHAGYRYSGATAGYAFAAVRHKSFPLVAVLSPLHDFHPAAVFTNPCQAYATPLGAVTVDHASVQAVSRRLAELCGMEITALPNEEEHALEIELPFLQVALSDDFQLLPIMVRTLDKTILHALGSALAGVLKDRSALLVASSDLSHFYPLETARRLDRTMLGKVEAFQPEEVLNAELSRKGQACGAGAIAAALWASRELGADRVTQLHYATSGEETGDFASVVGYAAAVILRSQTGRS